MTNPTTPQPVQEPAGAVEALRLARAHIVWLAFGECRSPGWLGAPPTALEAVEAIDAALASLPPVTQATDGPAHSYALQLAKTLWSKHFKSQAPNWEPLPDTLGLLTQIDNMVAGITQAKSEAVAPFGWYYEHKTGDGGPHLVFERWSEPGRSSYVETTLYDTPQEAVERQPLTRELALLLAAKVDLARDYNNDGDVQSTRREDADITDSVLAFAQAVEHFHGIGPATQEKQHG